MATNVEPPRPGAVGGAAAAGTAPGSTTTTPGVSKKEPIGKRGREEGRESPARLESSQGKVFVIGECCISHAIVKVANLHQSLGFVGVAPWEYFDVGVTLLGFSEKWVL